METILLIFIFVVGYVLGQIRAMMKIGNILREAADNAGIDLEQELERRKQKLTNSVKKLEVEKINDMLYLYERDTNDFICQANSMEDLAKLAKEYKNIALATVIHDNKVFMFKHGVSTEYTGQHES